MRITALVENTAQSPALKKRHGLSLHIQTKEHQLLFDLGPDDTLLYNAAKLGINLAAVDTVVISHGHSDHGGALAHFLQANPTAPVYLHRSATTPHFARVGNAKIPIGLDAAAHSSRVRLTAASLRIDKELFLFADVAGSFNTAGNRALLCKTGGRYLQDTFAHEQNLLVATGGKTVLFTGCSHRGIANIVRAAQRHAGRIHAVVGGFHLLNPFNKSTEEDDTVYALAKELLQLGPVFYTCHCTGMPAFGKMKEIMGENLLYLSAGMAIDIP